MAKTFFPKATVKVKASPPHKDAEYVVTVGTEMWDAVPQKVIKVQMAYEGKISGRRSPSYPYGTNDFERVNDAIKQLLADYKE